MSNTSAMIIRKIKKNGIVNVAKLLKWVLLIVGVFLILKGIASLQGDQEKTRDISPDQVGEELIVQGRLSSDNNFPYYTHSIIDATKNKIGIKSASVNLNDYSGQVELIGKVEKFLKHTPILEVSAIKLPDQKLRIKNNSYYFADDFLLLDFSTQPQLSATKSGDAVVVLFDGEVVVEIERFACAKIFRGENCSLLIDEYIKEQKDMFISLGKYPFYKHGDSNRIVFEGDLFGYIFKYIEDETLLNLSSMITLVNKDFLLKNKSEEIKNICSSSADPIQKIVSSSVKYTSKGVITLSLSAKTNTKNTIDCTIAFDPWDQWAIKKLSAIK